MKYSLPNLTRGLALLAACLLSGRRRLGLGGGDFRAAIGG